MSMCLAFILTGPVASVFLIRLLTLAALMSFTLSLVMAGVLPWLFSIF